jgi:hypothetical protein
VGKVSRLRGLRNELEKNRQREARSEYDDE